MCFCSDTSWDGLNTLIWNDTRPLILNQHGKCATQNIKWNSNIIRKKKPNYSIAGSLCASIMVFGTFHRIHFHLKFESPYLCDMFLLFFCISLWPEWQMKWTLQQEPKILINASYSINDGGCLHVASLKLVNILYHCLLDAA